MTVDKKYLDIFKKLDWNVSFNKDDDSDNEIELEKYSPENEEYLFYVRNSSIAEDARAEANAFDVDEHVLMWADHRGEDGVPSTIRELLEDAEAIQDMLNELASALEEVQ